jgi:hypothetical protein
MAYDNFENTPFDLNHDGHIDSNEAAYIHETFYNEDNTEDDDSSEVYSGGDYSSHNCSNFNKSQYSEQLIENILNGKAREELERAVRRKSIRKNCVFIAMFMLFGEFICGHLGTGIVISAIILVVGFSIK